MIFFALINQNPTTEIRLSEKYLHRHPSEVLLKYNKTKYQIRTVIAIILSVLVLLSATREFDIRQSDTLLLITIIAALVLIII